MPEQTAESLIAETSAADHLSPEALANLQKWLSEPQYADYAPIIEERLKAGEWENLEEAFRTILVFGTGGRRGWMYPVGPNAINDRTIGESAQGMVDYIKELDASGNYSCAIAYDTRHGSRHFAELCAEVMVAGGFQVYFLDGHRSTPELSYAVRAKNCTCGIMITASHNPPCDNAVKAYWSTGGQLLPPHDQGIIAKVMEVVHVNRTPFAEAMESGKVVYCQEEIDAGYLRAMLGQSRPGPRNIKILYSPMHGVGATSILPVLKAAGFEDVTLCAKHADPDPDFPNVPGNSANPENPATFDLLIEEAGSIDAELILSSDPDADRLGAAARITAGADWGTISGNHIGALLVHDMLENHRGLTPEHYVVKTLVTTDLVQRIAESFGVKTYGNLLVGFKWIGGEMDIRGPEHFVFGTEESHGYLAGTYARDKDAGVAALLLAELAARLKHDSGQTLHEKLDALFWQFGCHAERTISQPMRGAEGLAKTKLLMDRFRTEYPETLGGIKVTGCRDYANGVIHSNGKQEPFEGPKGDLVILDLEQEGNYVAVRPSGTEPKVKFYMLTYEAPELIADMDDAKADLQKRLDDLEADLRAFADAT